MTKNCTYYGLYLHTGNSITFVNIFLIYSHYESGKLSLMGATFIWPLIACTINHWKCQPQSAQAIINFFVLICYNLMLQQLLAYLIIQSVKSFEYELKQRVKIFWTWWCYKDIWISKQIRKLVMMILMYPVYYALKRYSEFITTPDNLKNMPDHGGTEPTTYDKRSWLQWTDYHLRDISSSFCLQKPSTTVVKNIFMYDRAKLWNSIPKDIRESKAISSFWNKIATHIYD